MSCGGHGAMKKVREWLFVGLFMFVVHCMEVLVRGLISEDVLYCQ